MMNRFIETQDGWNITLKDGVLNIIQIDFRLKLLITDKKGDVWVTIETEGILEQNATKVGFSPEKKSSLSPIIILHDSKINRIIISKTGFLDIDFEKGQKIHVPPHEEYEAWQIGCEFLNLLIVCGAGGSVSIFDEG